MDTFDTGPDGVLARLAAPPGTWRGRGRNHEDEAFDAVLVARPLYGSGGVLTWFRATGDDGTVFHEEIGLIGPGADGHLTMAAASNNLPFVQRFDGRAPSRHRLAVDHGDVSTDAGFRETIRLSFDEAGALTLSFDWALPGEPMAERSAVVLEPSPLPPPPDAPLR